MPSARRVPDVNGAPCMAGKRAETSATAGDAEGRNGRIDTTSGPDRTVPHPRSGDS